MSPLLVSNRVELIERTYSDTRGQHSSQTTRSTDEPMEQLSYTCIESSYTYIDTLLPRFRCFCSGNSGVIEQMDGSTEEIREHGN